MVRPKKHLGQHFLIDKNIANTIVDSLSLNQYNHVIEIGPGMGVLTEELIHRFAGKFPFCDIVKDAQEDIKKQFEKNK